MAKDPKKEEDQIGLFLPAEASNPFRKAVQVVHSKPLAPLSLLQRKMLNAWLQKANESKQDADGWWSLRIDTMSHDIGFNSNNRAYLKESAEALMRIVFAWDVVAPAEKRAKWKASVLFPEVEINSDTIKFQISSQIREHILNPEMYALIDQAVLRKYRRNASAGIYEHCIRYERIGQTAIVPWQEFRDIILGVSADKKSYQAYKSFKQKCLLPCIEEINLEGAIKIELKETKAGKSVEGLFFKVVKAKKADAEGDLSKDESDEVRLELVAQITRLGVLQSEAKKMMRNNAAADVRGALAYTANRMANKSAGKLENPAAYFRKALEQKWAPSPQVEDVEPRPVKPQAKKESGPDLETLFTAKRMADAANYFGELDAEDQQITITSYNRQQPTAGLQIKEKSGKAAQAGFYTWLAKETWGEATMEQKLEFATTLLMKQG